MALSSAFEEARRQLLAQEVAARYGIETDRSGRALCPFHDDRHPSMTFRGAYYHCWACEAKGDAIDLTVRLLGLRPMEALTRLNEDFRLGLSLRKAPDRRAMSELEHKRRVAAAFVAWEKWAFQILARYFQRLRAQWAQYQPHSMEAALHPLFVESLQMLERVDYWLGILRCGSYSEKLGFYDTMRKRVNEIAGEGRAA